MLAILIGFAGLYLAIGVACSTIDRLSEPPGFYRAPTGSIVQFITLAIMWPAWLAEALSIRL